MSTYDCLVALFERYEQDYQSTILFWGSAFVMGLLLGLLLFQALH